MEHEKKDRATNEEKVGELTEPIQSSRPAETPEEAIEIHTAETIAATGNPARTFLTGVITAAILAIIAVVVAGLFQVTSRWLITCPQDLPVNDPAPILWKHIASSETTPASLGVPPMVAMQARFKGAVTAPSP